MSDRVSVLQIKLSNAEKRAYNIKETSSAFKNSVSLKVKRNGEPWGKITIKREFIPDSKHSIINVYSPTSQLVRDVSVLESFYSDVFTVLSELKIKSLVFLIGDWNAKVGKKIKQHMSVTIALEVLLVVFEIIVDNISLISAQSTTFSSAT